MDRMPELDYITVKGFKSIKSVEKLRLNPINIIIGPNGSGKSNFISVFAFLRAIKEGHLQDYVGRYGGANRLLHFGTKTTETIEIHISFQQGKNQYSITLTPTENDELIPGSEYGYYWDKSRYPEPYQESIGRIGVEAGISNIGGSKISKFVRRHLDQWRLYHFHDTSSTSPMKKTADINDNRFLRPDGSNLSSFLYYLAQKHVDSYNLIRKSIQRMVPFFNDFQLEPQRLNPQKIRLEWTHKRFDSHFDVSSLSDGTLRFIALATLFLQPEKYRPSVILVDEPELGLHPYAVALLASLIKQSSHKTQVVVSTQSPLLLDHFSPEDVLVTNRKDDGTSFERLKSDYLKSWLKEYSLGQLWEKNEIGGRPKG